MSTFKKAILQLHLFVFLAGLTGPLGYLIHLNGLVLVFYRMFITVIALQIIYFFNKNKIKYSRKTIASLLGVGCIIALHWVCFYGSIKLANVSIALVCFSSTSLFTSLIEPIASKQTIKWRDLSISFLSIIGIYLIFHFDSKFRTGIMVGVFSAFLASVFSVMNKEITKSVDIQSIQVFEMLGGVLFLMPIVFIVGWINSTAFIFPTTMDWIWLVILALGCTVWANHLMLSALKHISAFTLNVTLNLEPVYGIILAFVLFKEQKQLGSSFYIGFVLIILSVMIQMIRIVRQNKMKNSL